VYVTARLRLPSFLSSSPSPSRPDLVFRLVGPAGARRLDPPDRAHRDELPFKPHECRKLITDDPGVGIRRHASQQRGEELEPGPEPGPQHVVSGSFLDFADQHLMLARRCQLQLDEAGRGREGYDVDGFARTFGEVFRDRNDHSIIDVRRQVERAVEHLLPSVFVSPGAHTVLSGGSLQRDLSVLGKCGSALHQVVALHGKDSLLSEYHFLVVYRSVLEAKYHATLDLSAPLNLEEIARRKEFAVNRAKHKETVGDALDEAYRDRSRRGRSQPQQHRHENQQAKRRRPRGAHDARAGNVDLDGAPS
jgi:hypothetical protein